MVSLPIEDELITIGKMSSHSLIIRCVVGEFEIAAVELGVSIRVIEGQERARHTARRHHEVASPDAVFFALCIGVLSGKRVGM